MALMSLPLQGAIMTALKADAGVAALVATRVLDDVPSDPDSPPPFPYIVYGAASSVEAGASDFDAQAETVTLHGWSQYDGQKQAKQILAAIYAVLHDASLPITGGTLVNLRFADMQTLRDPDGETYHGVIRFRAYVQAD